MKMENKAKYEIVEALLRKFDTTIESGGSARKIILDFTPPADYQEHQKILGELKKERVIKDFKTTGDSFDIFEPIKYRLYKMRNSLIAEPKTQKLAGSKMLSFDPDSGKIKFGEKECEFPFKKIEYYIIKALFEYPPGTKVKENDLVTYIDSEACEADSPSRVYDGIRRINQRILKDLGIKKLISYKAANYWMHNIE